jgi:hypothetical protein
MAFIASDTSIHIGRIYTILMRNFTFLLAVLVSVRYSDLRPFVISFVFFSKSELAALIPIVSRDAISWQGHLLNRDVVLFKFMLYLIKVFVLTMNSIGAIHYVFVVNVEDVALSVLLVV